MVEFYKISVSQEDLKLQNVLQAGQAFRWIWDDRKNWYMTSMVISGFVGYGIIVLKQDEGSDHIEFGFQHPKWDQDVVDKHLKQYFRLEIDLQNLYEMSWKLNDNNFTKIRPQGIRILFQEPWETLVSFICSSNNNISRITKMCHNLSTYYGDKVGTFNDHLFYSFPTSDQLAARASEQKLRELGFGYRAKYILETAKMMVKDKKHKNFHDDAELLLSIKETCSYEETREYLMRYTGVGPKVADCVCLMGLHIDHVVPVDVHVARFAKRDYNIDASKSEIAEIRDQYNCLKLPITKKKINPQLDFIRKKLIEKWGPYAGWAQGILFFKEVGSTAGATASGDIQKNKRSFPDEIGLETKADVKRVLTAPKVEA